MAGNQNDREKTPEVGTHNTTTATYCLGFRVQGVRNLKTSKKIRPGTLFIVIGVLALVTAGGIWYYNISEENAAAMVSTQLAQELYDHIYVIQITQAGVTAPIETIVDPEVDIHFPLPEVVEDEEGIRYITVNEVDYIGVLSIPDLSLSLPVNRDWSYPALRNSPCRFSGSIEEDSIVIAAHNYRSHFSAISGLRIGAPVSFLDIEGVEHHYTVEYIQTVEPTEVVEVVHSGYDLTLFTCTYGGAARVVVRCMRAER